MATATTTINVIGMTCGHCAASVTTELSRVGGATDAQIDLATGAVEITSETPIGAEAIAAAVDEAGYEVSS